MHFRRLCGCSLSEDSSRHLTTTLGLRRKNIMITCNESEMRGVNVLRNPWFNKSSTFTEEERDRYGLRGLLPPRVSSVEEQTSRLEEVIASQTTPLGKYLILDGIHSSDEAAFFRLVIKNIEEYMPLIYTPTVGEACQKFSHIFRYARGLYVSIKDRGRVRELLKNVPTHDVDMIVVTDGQRILGLGDLGINGMGIPIGKLALYTACAGISPQRVLPVTLDVGTNTESYLNDPLYLGLKQKRVDGEEYYALVQEFIESVRERWPNVIIQFEDFQNTHAFELLARWQDKVPCFNDDIQGTASVCVTGLYSAMRVTHSKLSEQRVLFMGAGSAATGIAHLIADAMEEEGLTREEALKNIALVDSKGLVSSQRTDQLAANKVTFAHDLPLASNLMDAIKIFKPTAIIGVSAQAKAFSKEVIGLMSELNDRPIIYALSNPTSKAECTAEEAYEWSDGRAIFASGSPFAPVTAHGKTFVPRQGNNSYVFPGIGLGCVIARPTMIPTGVFLTAAKRLADLVSEEDLEKGSMYPPLAQVRELSAEIARSVAEYLFDKGLARAERPADILKAVKDYMWSPDDPHFVCGE